MSPKKWKVQLAATWNSKALKARNATNEAWLMIIDNDNDNELSDYHDSDDNWHDNKFENDLDLIHKLFLILWLKMQKIYQHLQIIILQFILEIQKEYRDTKIQLIKL